MKDWWLDELVYAGAEHLNVDYVWAYERKAGFDPREDIEALASHGLTSTSTLLDFGAGTGVFVMAAAKECAHVVAVDVSPQMISSIENAKLREGLTNIEIVRAGLLTYEHAADPVDFVYSRNVLHQLPDFWKGIALDRIRSVLRPGGIFRFRDLVFDFEPSDSFKKIEEWISGAVEDPERGFTADDLAEHVREEYSTYSWLMEPLLEKTGFQILDRQYRRNAYATYTCRVTDKGQNIPVSAPT